MVVFRSGQAALASILQFVAAAWGDRRTLSVAHAGAYFETTALLAAWPRRTFRPTPASVVSADVVIGGRSGATASSAPRIACRAPDACCSTPRWWGRRTTFAPPCRRRRRVRGRDRLQLRPQARPGRAGASQRRHRPRPRARWSAAACAGIAGRLRQLRGLMATGLTLDELWRFPLHGFSIRLCRHLHRRHLRQQPAAGAVDRRRFGRLRAALPSVAVGDRAAAPFCALQLREHRPRVTGVWPRSSSSRASSAGCC